VIKVTRDGTMTNIKTVSAGTFHTSFLAMTLCGVNLIGTPIAVRQAVIPAAGLGTRLMPFTKSVSKEMVTVLNKPAIHYILKECVDSGIDDIIFVVGETNTALKHYLSRDMKIESALAKAGKSDLLRGVNSLLDTARYSFVKQHEPLGSGHAVQCVRHLITDDYFAVIYPDELLVSETEPGLQQVIAIAQKYGGAVMPLAELSMEEISATCAVRIKEELEDGVYRLSGIVEKPKAEDAPSNLIGFGRYVLPYRIFDYLEHLEPGYNGELQFTDALDKLIASGFPVFGYKVRARRFNLGLPWGWLEANVYLGMRKPRYREVIQKLVKQNTAAVC